MFNIIYLPMEATIGTLLIGIIFGVAAILIGQFLFKKSKEPKLTLDKKDFEPGPEKRHNETEV